VQPSLHSEICTQKFADRDFRHLQMGSGNLNKLRLGLIVVFFKKIGPISRLARIIICFVLFFFFLISFSFEGQNWPIDHRAKPSRTEKPRASRGASPASERDGSVVFGGH
jgi:hypothetical protein